MAGGPGRPRLDGSSPRGRGVARPSKGPGRPPSKLSASKNEGKAAGSATPPTSMKSELSYLTAFKATGLLPVGTKLPVRKRSDNQLQPAEILAIKQKDLNTRLYYVHYCDFNKRLDEWVTEDRLDTSNLTKIIFPKSEAEKREEKRRKLMEDMESSGQATPSKSGKENQQSNVLVSPSSSAAPSPSASGESVSTAMDVDVEKNGAVPLSTPLKVVAEGDSQAQVTENAAATTENNEDSQPPLSELTFEQDLQRLRKGGSMTQRTEEVARVKNINKIQFGKHLIETWYFSPYPQEFEGLDIVYICEFCLKYMSSEKAFERHRTKCNLKHPPGNEIYRKGTLSFFELDGHKQKTFCRNLCLVSKLFLDHKTLYYDVDPFLFYVMTETDAKGCHLVGYFSKEKDSVQGYNLACILTMPQYQRKGFGKLLIAFSYELSKIEGKVGSPEKPLSDLGLLSYRSYWFDTIMSLIVDMQDEISIEDLSQRTGIIIEDVLHTLSAMNMLRYYHGNHIICITQKHREDYYKSMEKQKRKIDPMALNWTPPVFSSSQLRYI